MDTKSVSFNDKRQQRRKCQTLQDFIVVWLDENFIRYMEQLHTILNDVQTFSDPDECIDFVTNVKKDKVFMIISSDYVFKDLISFLHPFPQLQSFYIYHDDYKTVPELWTNKWRKVKGVFTTISSIYHELKQNIKQCELDLISFSILSFVSANSTDLNELDQSFMYSQLLTEILLDLNNDEQAKITFVEFCRMQADDTHELHVINEFEKDYEHHSPIWWYTKESFIYSVLNRALRTQDTEIVIKMGFFVRDLHQQIKQLHLESDEQKLITVFRGQGMFNDELIKLKKNKDGLFSFNSFLSTSIDREVAYLFADSARNNSNLTGIIFRMEINPNTRSCPFVSLDNISYYSESEKEILFSMHTVFRIGEMEEIDERLWQISLTLTNDEDPQLRRLTEHLRKDIDGTGLFRLGQLMIKMNELNKAQEIYETILDRAHDNDPQNTAYAHHQLGWIYHQISDFEDSLSHYRQSLEAVSTCLPIDDPSLSPTYNNIGLILKEQGKFDDALAYFQHALAID
jgi:hypothetical protein